MHRSGMLLLALAACGADRAPRDAPCRYNSDCGDALVCADSVCRAQCRADRDCGSGSCGPSGVPGVRACLPPSSPFLCAFHSECPEGALCVDGRCRAECREDRDCGDGQSCTAGGTAGGTCSDPLVTPPGGADGGVPTGCVVCGARCVDLQRDPAHCGACGYACPALQACADGVCVDRTDCTAPYHMVCAGECVDTSSDPLHCGACGNACARACLGQYCQPAYDTCDGALEIDLSSGSARAVFSMYGTRHDVASCGPGADAYLRFRLDTRSLVRVGAASPASSLSVGIGTSCGGGLACETCTGGDAQVVRVLEPGEHIVVADQLSSVDGREEMVVDVDAVPIGDMIAVALPPGTSAMLGTTRNRSSSPGSCGAGPDAVFYRASCAESRGGLFSARVSSAAFAPVLRLVHGAGLGSICVRDGCAPDTCLMASIGSGAGLSVLFVDGDTPADAGDFTLDVTVP